MALSIVVATEQDKLELLEGSEHIHDLWELDTDIPGANTLAHLYQCPENIHVQPLRKPQDDCVPGKLRCAKCNFVINKVNLNMGDGTVTAGSNASEPCPNGCGPLWPITWKQEAHSCWDDIERMAEELIELRKLKKE